MGICQGLCLNIVKICLDSHNVYLEIDKKSIFMIIFQVVKIHFRYRPS